MIKKEVNVISIVLILYACITIVGNLIEGLLFHSQGRDELYQIDMATIVIGFVLLFVILIWRECVTTDKEIELWKKG